MGSWGSWVTPRHPKHVLYAFQTIWDILIFLTQWGHGGHGGHGWPHTPPDTPKHVFYAFQTIWNILIFLTHGGHGWPPTPHPPHTPITRFLGVTAYLEETTFFQFISLPVVLRKFSKNLIFSVRMAFLAPCPAPTVTPIPSKYFFSYTRPTRACTD